MLHRALAREGVGERQQQRLRAAGVRHFRQLAQRSPWDVAHAADLSVREVEVRALCRTCFLRSRLCSPQVDDPRARRSWSLASPCVSRRRAVRCVVASGNCELTVPGM